MRKQILLITFVLKLFDVFCFRVILAKSSVFFIVYSFKLLLFFEMHVHETGKLYFLKKILLNGRSRHFFDINKSTATNHIKFKQLPRQSLLKSTLKRFLNHSNNRYLEQKIYRKTTTNNLTSYRNLSSQKIFLSNNYKFIKTLTL